MLAWLSNPLYKIGAIILLCVGVLVGIHYYNKHQQGIGYQKAVAEYNQKKLEAIAAAEKITASWKEKYEQSEQERASLVAEINRLSSVNSVSVANVGRLRVTVSNLSKRLSEAADKTCVEPAATISAVFDECTERLEWIAIRYAELGTKADRHVADAKALSDSFPE